MTHESQGFVGQGQGQGHSQRRLYRQGAKAFADFESPREAIPITCMGAHTDSLQIAENSDSENYEADADNAAVSDATAAADINPTDGDGGDDCEVCLVAPRNNSIALVPCGHRRFCSSCADEVYNRARGCPICRANITMILRLF